MRQARATSRASARKAIAYAAMALRGRELMAGRILRPRRSRRTKRLPRQGEAVAQVVLQLHERPDPPQAAGLIGGTQVERANRPAPEALHLLGRELVGGEDRQRSRRIEDRLVAVLDHAGLDHVVAELR